MTTVHMILPNDIDDPARPSGGNVYDRRLIDGLSRLGLTVVTHCAVGSWPTPTPGDVAALRSLVDGLGDGCLVLVDGLVAARAPAGLFERLRVVVLVHMPLQAAGEAAVLSSVQAVVTTSSWTRDLLIDAYAIPAHRITVATPGVQPAPVAPPSAGGGRLLCVAAVAPHKGHDVLVSALASLGDLDWECVCVGSLERDPSFAASLDTVPGLSFTGPLTGTPLDNAFASADLVVLPSRAETYGMVVTEALARGIPVVVSDVGGVREALGAAPGATTAGLLVPPSDPPALAGALRSWLTSADLRASLRAAALARRAELTGWERTAEIVANVLSIVDGSGFPAPQVLLAGAPSVSPAWLALREPADAAARSQSLLAPLRRRFNGSSRLVIHDLGCGTGSMARWLAPKLPGPQHWVLHDRDGELLERAAIDVPGKAWDGSIVAVETRQSDITRLTAEDLADADLVTASALLDMLTRDEVRRIAAACAGRPALFTISVAGRVDLTPPDPLDARITAAFNEHQRRTADGRGLLGPDAITAMIEALASSGVPATVVPSPWRLGPDDGALIAEWLLGWVAAACEHDPSLAGPARAYARRRLAEAAAGRLTVVVHHEDLLAGCG